MPLTTTAYVQTALGVPAGQDLARWDALRLAAEAAVENYCKRSFAVQNYTEYLYGNGTRYLTLRQRPVTSVATVLEAQWGSWGQGNDAATVYVPLNAGDDYALVYGADAGAPLGRKGILAKLKGYWPEHRGYTKLYTLALEREPGLGNVKVVYTAGMSVIPQDLQFAVALVAAYMHRTAERGGKDYSERLGDHSYMIPMARIREAPDLGEPRQILSRYRELPW